MPLNLNVGDIVDLKKQHPCGGKTFQVLRVGMDFKLKCTTCGRMVLVPRNKTEKNIKKVMRENTE